MSGEIPSLVDLQNTKVRIDHFAELIDGTPSGTSTNPITGITHPTYEKAIKDLGFKPASFTFVIGGTLGVADADKCIYNPAPAGDDNWYSWSGAFPHAVAPGTDPTVVGSGYVPRTDIVLRAGLADNNSTVEIGKSTAGDVGNRVSQFATDGEITGSNDATAAAAVSVNGIRLTMNRHAFEDWTRINATDSGLGYSSFDAQAVLDTANDVDHYVGYQSRNIIAGSGDITGYCHAYNAQIQHHGTGHIANVVGVKVSDPTITNGGTIGEVVGILIEEPTKGTTSNYPLYILGNKPSHLDCPIELSNSSINSTIRQNTGWLWTQDGTLNGTKRGGFYVDQNGQFHLFSGVFDDVLVGNSAGAQAKKDFTAEAKFACNNATPQGKAAVNAACTDLPTAIALINQLRAALIANGICV